MSSQGTSSALAAAAAILAAACWLFIFAPNSSGDARSIEDRSIFYRLVTKYQHGDEIIDFDIVVGCAIRVTRWGDGDKSYDAFRDPAVYVKAIGGGHAVMQIVPDACRGETTENGEVPDDFLPGALWFEHADDLSFGIAYVTEDAFDSPRSDLKFLGASIRPATRADYVAFEPTAAKNLMDPRPLFAFMPMPSLEEVKRQLGDSKELVRLWPGISCKAVTRVHLSDPVQRAIVRRYWPAAHPRYWSPSGGDLKEINKQIHLYSELLVDGRRVTDYSRLNYNVGNGFPTRAHGGVLGSKHRMWDKLPPTVFPLRRNEGIPWLTENYLAATMLHRDIDAADGANRGFAYCYGEIAGDGLSVPAYSTGGFESRVDGEPIYGEADDRRAPRDRPWPFFERDEYFYSQDDFGLN